MPPFLSFENISKSFGSHKAVDNVSVDVSRGEIFSLLGPSGCGKTTLLRMCAGFEEPDSGRILLDGVDITNIPPHKRKVNTVFQNYALFPHLSLRENIAFGLRIAKRPEKEIQAEVDKMLDLVQLTDHADKLPAFISGGQKQRVAIARALINKPQVLLLDEPLAALDLKLRQRMLVELDGIHDEVGITFLYITHDQGEAMGISDNIAVMNQGRIEQIGKPTEVYEAPRSSFVAAFIGDTNFFEGTVTEEKGTEYLTVKIDGFPDVTVFNDKNAHKGDPVYLSIRPEKFSVSVEKPAENEHVNAVEGIVEEVIYMGSHTRYWIRVQDYRISTNRQHIRYALDEKPIQWKDRVWLSWRTDDGYMLERYAAADEKLLILPEE